VTSISVKRSVKLYRENGTRGFYAPRMTRGAAVLVDGVVARIEELLAGGEIAELRDPAMQHAVAIGAKRTLERECTPLRTCLSGTTVPPVRPASPGRLGRVALQQFVKVSGPSPSFGRIGLDGYESAYPNGPGPLQ
jgi:hypothetical protein